MVIKHKKTRKSIILGSLISLFIAGCGTPKNIKQANPFPAKDVSMKTKKLYLSLINKERKKGNNCGKAGYFKSTTRLTWNNSLYTAASEHNYDMANTNTFSHFGTGTKYDWTRNKSSLKDRIENNGYRGWNHISENIAAGVIYKTPEKAIKAWIESDYHCLNLMDPKAKEVGMSIYKKEGSEHTYYWTQNFGSRR